MSQTKTIKTRLKNTWTILKQTIDDFSDLNVTRSAAALAYYAIFSIAPILIIVIRFSALFAMKETRSVVFDNVEKFVGANAASQIQAMIQNAIQSGSSGIAYTVSIIALLFSATSVFVQIQTSINEIWRLRIKPSKSIGRLIISRLISFGMVVGLSFILLASLLVSAILTGLNDVIIKIFPDFSIVSVLAINAIITILTTTALFFGIFKLLPDAYVKSKDVFYGAIITALLFMLGRWGISMYLSHSRISSTYGAAGSLIVILLWIYYSAIILYFGATLTRVKLEFGGGKIVPKEYAEQIQTITTDDKLKAVLKNKEVV